MAKEKQFENKVKEYLKSIGAWYIKYWAGSNFTKEGIPDLLVCYKGKFIAIEIKGLHGEPTLIQLVNLFKIQKANGIGILLYPNDFDAFKSFLNASKEGVEWYEENKRLQKRKYDKLNKAPL